ncbi:hypothetical protein DV737_g165, partial [Chaetothyriales sp. CBS 132003]
MLTKSSSSAEMRPDGTLTCAVQPEPGWSNSSSHWIIEGAQISRKHLRVYSVVYDADDPCEVDLLVYAQDLSQNGTFWNGSFIGKGNGGVLLSQDDTLKLAPNVFLSFQSNRGLDTTNHFDLVQEKEMRTFADSYTVTDRLLGSGAFGRVFMAVEQKTRSQLACKVVDLRRFKQQGSSSDREKQGSGKLEDKLRVYYREVEILSSISHPNIISLENVFVTHNTLQVLSGSLTAAAAYYNRYMFQDLVTAGDLFSYIESKNGKLLEVEAAVIIRQVSIALCFLHENDIVHRDLKPDNILMTSLSAGCRIVLTDFGAARRIHSPSSRMLSIVGTDEYAAPEVFGSRKHRQGEKGYTSAVDMWSLGCVTVVLLTGGSAFNDPETNTYSEQLAKECDLRLLQQSSEWQEVRARPAAFVEKLLVLDEDQRMSAQQARDHEWFSNEIHRTNFHELYQRTIKHWKRRSRRTNILEFQDAAATQKRTEALVKARPASLSRHKNRRKKRTLLSPSTTCAA